MRGGGGTGGEEGIARVAVYISRLLAKGGLLPQRVRQEVSNNFTWSGERGLRLEGAAVHISWLLAKGSPFHNVLRRKCVRKDCSLSDFAFDLAVAGCGRPVARLPRPCGYNLYVHNHWSA